MNDSNIINMRMRINRSNPDAKSGRLLTLQRRLLLDTLREADDHLGARDLYQRVIEKDPRISLATVYRNLRLFRELGLVEERRLDEVHCYYEIKPSSEHYHMVCTACGRVLEFESPLVNDIVAEVRQKSDFVITRAVLYLEGYCPECKEKKKTQ